MKAIAITAATGLLVALFQQVWIANLKTTIAERDGAIAELNAAIKTQNNAIDALKTAGQLDSSNAAGRVASALLDGERLKAKLPKGAGPKAMNEFQRVVFQ